jgi:tetratricopeptide (TPR) repeat protein
MVVQAICLTWMMTLFAGADIHAAPRTPDRFCLTADDQFTYAQRLFADKVFLEAAAEFRRFVYFFPDDRRVETAGYQTGMAFFSAGRYRRAIDSFKKLIEESGDTPLGVKAHFRISECYLALGTPGEALIPLFNLIALTDDPLANDLAYYRAGWIYLDSAQWNRARSAFENIRPEKRDQFNIQPLLARMKKRVQLKQKNPKLAGILAVVPGAGHLYCGRYRDALTAFVVNGLFAWAAAESFDNDQAALGSLLTTAGLGFYTGSIFGSVSGARKFNQTQTRHFIDTLKREMKVSLSAVFRPGGGALMAHFPF